jgi:FtsZ-interacting cell division protein ZipA
MSELQIGLLVIGVVTIAAVIAYNKILDLKYRRLAEKNFASSHDDALLEPADMPAKPIAVAHALDELEPVAQTRVEPARIEPTLADDTARDIADPDDALPRSAGDEFEAIFWTARMSGSNPLNAAQLAEAFDAVRQAFSKPSRLLAWNRATQGWNDAKEGGADTYHFAAGIQLVDRQGAISVDELAKFQASTAGFADEFKLGMEPVDLAEPQERARKIDDFCCDVDIQIVLHLVSADKPFAGSKIRAIAEADGFRADSSGLFKRFDEDGHCLYTLANEEGGVFILDTMKDTTSSSISLHFDLPRAPGGIATFDHFCSAASRFAMTLGARLVDDNRVEIGAGALKSIREQVGQVQARMSAAGYPPGSPVALSLFS